MAPHGVLGALHHRVTRNLAYYKKAICLLFTALVLFPAGTLLSIVHLFPDSAAYHSLRSHAGYLGLGWCSPHLPPRIPHTFDREQPWAGDALFWENFPCARNAYRVYPPEGAAPPAANRSNLIVTGYFDIGRGKWSHYQRSNEDYFSNMERNVLTLRNPMVFFTTPDQAEAVVAARRRAGLMDRTMVVAHDLHCTSQAWMLPGVVSNMCSERTLKSLWAFNPSLDVPERQQPWYNLVMWMKAGVVRAAATLPHPALASEWVTWLDAGCRAPVCEASWMSGIYLEPAPWARAGRIRITHMEVQDDGIAQLSPVDWTRQHRVLFMGGCFGMTRVHARALMDAFLDTVQWLYVRGVVDTDQTVFAWTWMKQPELFDVHFTTGDYFSKLAAIVRGFAGI